MLRKKSSPYWLLKVFVTLALFSCSTREEQAHDGSTPMLDTVSSTDEQTVENDSGHPPQPTAIELLGNWEIDNPIPNNPNSPLQNQSLEITETRWGNSPLMTWDNAQNFAVIESPANDPFFSGLFHRVVWTEPQGFAVYTCQVAQGLETVEQAKFSTAKANDQDFENGCNGFPWQRLLKLED